MFGLHLICYHQISNIRCCLTLALLKTSCISWETQSNFLIPDFWIEIYLKHVIEASWELKKTSKGWRVVQRRYTIYKIPVHTLLHATGHLFVNSQWLTHLVCQSVTKHARVILLRVVTQFSLTNALFSEQSCTTSEKYMDCYNNVFTLGGIHLSAQRSILQFSW